MPSASPPRRLIQSAHWLALSAITSTQTTLAPSSASPPAMPPPMFGLVPVTIATLPSSFTRYPLLRTAQNGPDARRRPSAAREAYSLYVERAAEGANEADGPSSTACRQEGGHA